MYKKLYPVMLALSAVLLTQCKKDDVTPLLDAIVAPKVSLTLASENSTLQFSKAETTKDDDYPAFIDLNNNLKQDAGEELVASKEYPIPAKNVIIFGHINSLTLNEQKNLSAIEVQNRFIKELNATDCVSLTTCKILKANSLEVIDISRSNAVETLELPNSEDFIKELWKVVMENPILLRQENFMETFINRLPSRKDKEKKGVFKPLSPIITTNITDALEAKGWKKE